MKQNSIIMKLNTRFLKWAVASLILLFSSTSCNKDLKNDINDLKDRVTTLEESVDLLDKAMASGKLIAEVSPVASTQTGQGGWLITLSDKSTIPIKTGSAVPYIWINSTGNWASYLGLKPADQNNPLWEIKLNGQSVKAKGGSVRVINKNRFIALEENDAMTETTQTVVTVFPFDEKAVISAFVETGEAIQFNIGGKEYKMAKVPVYPASITVIRDKDYVIKGGTVDFEIAVNPTNSKVYEKENFELSFEKNYTKAYGVAPDFIKIKDVKPSTKIKGQYTMTLEWAESETEFAKNAAIFIVLNCKDIDGNITQIISSTPVIMNEKYVSIKAENVLDMKDVVMFTDETYTDFTQLANYHKGYVNKVEYALAANPVSDPVALNPLTRYVNPYGDKYKFTIVPFAGDVTTVWPNGVIKRVTNITVSVTDYGRKAVDEIPAKPEIAQPLVPGIPAIPPTTINKDFGVTVYKVPADGIILRKNFQDRWLPNKTVDYTLTQALTTAFEDNGYKIADWDFTIKAQDLQLYNAKDDLWSSKPMEGRVTPDITTFSQDKNFSVSYKLLPTIDAGKYQVQLTIAAASKKVRPEGMKQLREFKIQLLVNVVAPKYQILYNGEHNLVGDNSDTYVTTTLKDVRIDFLFDVESNKNISKETDVTPNAAPLAYDYDLTDPRHGAQGIRFSPYPAVKAPLVTEWGTNMSIKKAITANVKLATGQSIPVNIICKSDHAALHSNSVLYVEYTRLYLVSVDAVKENFAGNYNAMITNGINIATGSNFTPISVDGKALDPTTISTVVFSAQGNVQSTGTLPNGLTGKQIMTINANTGMVTSIDGLTWENPDAVLFQVFRVTYTDIWGNTAHKDVKVNVKSNSVPSLP